MNSRVILWKGHCSVHQMFFDPQGDVTIYYRRLPHWDQPGVMSFLTWRTVDSIPTEVLARWRPSTFTWPRTGRPFVAGSCWRRTPSSRLRQTPRARIDAGEHSRVDSLAHGLLFAIGVAGMGFLPTALRLV